MPSTEFLESRLKECTFTETQARGSTFSGSLEGTLFHHSDLTSCDFSKASHYAIDPHTNKVKKARFAIPEVLSLLKAFDIEIE